MSRSLKAIGLGIAAALVCYPALAQLETGGQADRAFVAPVFPQSEFRAALKARGPFLASFINASELAHRTDMWTAAFESLGPVERAAVMNSMRAVSHPRDLMGLLANELPTRLAAQATGVQGPIDFRDGAPQLKFGSADAGELVYKPTLPCRVADTRLWSGGVGVQPGKTRQVWVWAVDFNYPWAAQGGTGTAGTGECALSFFASGAPVQVLANVTIVSPSNAGNARAYNGGTTLPATSTVNFVASQTVANAIAIPINRSVSSNSTTDAASQWGGPSQVKRDIGVYLDNATADVIIDVVGYFVAPTKSALDCVTTNAVTLSNQTTVGYKGLNAPACGAGYTLTATFCATSGALGASMLSNGSAGSVGCEWNQTGTGLINYFAHSRCCRTP